MKIFGMIMAAGGVLLGLIALLMRTAVHNDASYSYGNYIASSDTLNIGLLQNQHLTFLAGCFLFLAGVLVACTGVAVEAMQTSPRIGVTVDDAMKHEAAESYQLLARRGAMTEAEQKAANKADRTIIIGAIALAVAALVAVFVSGVGNSNPSQDAMITNNASAMADAMEKEADNLEAIAAGTKN